MISIPNGTFLIARQYIRESRLSTPVGYKPEAPFADAKSYQGLARREIRMPLPHSNNTDLSFVCHKKTNIMPVEEDREWVRKHSGILCPERPVNKCTP